MARHARITFSLPVPTEQGEFVALYSNAGLAGLNFPGRKAAGSTRGAVPETVRTWHTLTQQALGRALAGKPVAKLPPLDLSAGTEFQKSVWNVLSSIAPGNTMSYSEVATAIGRPSAVRAVGQACGANPIPVLVPCHRVLAANSKIGGFSGGGDWKRRLLANEGVQIQPAR